MAENLSATLTEYQRYRRRKAGCRVICRLAAVNLLAALFAAVADNLGGMSVAARLTVLLAVVGMNILLLIRAVRSWRSAQVSDREAAVALEALGGVRDNAIVNAVCFRDSGEVEPALLSEFVRLADNACQGVKVPSWQRDASCCFYQRMLGVSLIAVAIYLLLFFPYAVNALQRYFNPWSQLASLNFAQFTVAPGDAEVVAGDDLTVTASALRAGEKVTGLRILLAGDSAPLLLPMDNGSDKDSYVIRNIRQPLRYSIRCDGDSSREFRVKVRPRPQLRRLQLTVTPPAYTGLAQVNYDLDRKAVDVPPGSKLRLQAEVPSGFTVAFYDGDRGLDVAGLRDGITVDRELNLNAALTETGKRTYKGVWECRVKVNPDLAPTVRFLNHELNVEAGYGQTVSLFLQAEDDYGIAGITVTAVINGQEKLLREYRYDSPSPKQLRETVPVKIVARMFPAGESIRVIARVTDRHSPVQTGITDPPLTIHIVDLAARLKDKLAGTAEGRLYDLLYRALELQQSTRNWLSTEVRNIRRWEMIRLRNEQRTIAGVMGDAVKEAELRSRKGQLRPVFVQALKKLNDTDVKNLRQRAEELAGAGEKATARELNELIGGQTGFITRLQSLLAGMAAAGVEAEKERKATAEEKNEKQLFEKLDQLKNKLEEFKKEQRKVISQTESLDPKKAEDWSDAEEKLLGDLAAREQEWAQLFQAKFNDLSKLQNQDFSNSVMAQELVEMYEELQKAGKALEKKKIEIATLAENTAADFAESTSANLERWLSDSKDHIKWNAEEEGKMADTDLSDLPAELTDIIGDLVEGEEDMGEDTQDSTNSFTWDTDEALGWGVADGNIDSMQAKGITGNVMPNNNEVGGRSGEGRSGKSSGQFVEQDATGKGGRKTPTRLVQSPFEKGTVNDTSKDGSGGATGGGKQSGVGDEGLTGVTPDQDSDISQRLAGNQAELKQRAQALLRRLNDKGLPSGEVQEALRKMAASEKMLKQGDGVEARRLRSEAVAALKNARNAVDQTVKADYERVIREKRQEYRTRYQNQEKIPAGYEDTVGLYFKSLSEEQ